MPLNLTRAVPKLRHVGSVDSKGLFPSTASSGRAALCSGGAEAAWTTARSRPTQAAPLGASPGRLLPPCSRHRFARQRYERRCCSSRGGPRRCAAAGAPATSHGRYSPGVGTAGPRTSPLRTGRLLPPDGGGKHSHPDAFRRSHGGRLEARLAPQTAATAPRAQ